MLVALVLAPQAWAAPQSNPAFLGLGMFDQPPGCRVDTVTPDSPAAAAGIQLGDIILAIDDVRTQVCSVLSAQIVAHQIGDTARLEVLRMGQQVVVQARLSSRAAIVHRRLVGRVLEPTEVTDLDDLQTYDLDELRGHTTIVGLFTLAKCDQCAALFRKIVDGTRGKHRDTAPRVLALTSGNPKQLESYRSNLNFGVPVYATNEDLLDRTGIQREDRVYFLVVDARGIIRFVAPMAADADDLDAAIDELLAAAEQAEYARRR